MRCNFNESLERYNDSYWDSLVLFMLPHKSIKRRSYFWQKNKTEATILKFIPNNTSLFSYFSKKFLKFLKKNYLNIIYLIDPNLKISFCFPKPSFKIPSSLSPITLSKKETSISNPRLNTTSSPLNKNSKWPSDSNNNFFPRKFSSANYQFPFPIFYSRCDTCRVSYIIEAWMFVDYHWGRETSEEGRKRWRYGSAELLSRLAGFRVVAIDWTRR